jgi:ADP-ribose pyrophosphatase
MSRTQVSPGRFDHFMSDHSTITKVALSVLPSVKSPSPRFSVPEVIHRNPFENVSRVHAEFEGFIKDYYVVEFGPRAGIVAVSEGKILLTAQYRFLINGIAWEIPGGRVDEGEISIEAAQRECLEETGFFCTDLRPLLSFRPGLDNVENLTSVFYSEFVEERRSFAPDPAEALAIAWVPIEECVTLVLEQKIIDCLTVSAVLAYRCHLARR